MSKSTDKGWIKLSRKILDWGWHSSPSHFSFFVHLLFLANTEDKQWKGREIKRGTFITSTKKLSEITGLSESSVRRILNDLADSGEIVKEPGNKYTKITIINYSSYQFKSNEKRELLFVHTEQSDEQSSEQSNAQSSEQTDEQQLKNNKEYKELEEKENIKNVSEDEYEEIEWEDP